MLEVRLIGTFDIKCDGKRVTISSRAAQSLFAYLILNSKTVHRREKLAGVFWPDATEAKARAYLRHELWLIRKMLAAKTKSEYLIADDIGISFNASAEYWLDATTLENISEHATPEELMNGLSIFRGDLLPGFYDDWIVLEREHLQAVYEQKMARLLELLESEKRWYEILEWAERWISLGQEPEAAYRYLMIAYDVLGDRAKVTSTYERCAQALRELNLEPSEQTRALAFKRTSKLNIPIPLTSFIGREKELEEVADLFSKSRLITLTGSGGVGKTRLSIQVVAEILGRFPDGVWFLDLAPLSDPALLPYTLVNLLGLSQSGEMPLTEMLINYFRTRTVLLIFDNCEHLVESCAQLVNLLLTSCKNLSILATSREALRVSGEIHYRVPSLTIPTPEVEVVIDEFSNMESVKLFAERGAVALPGFAISQQNAPAIAQICQRLDGIPLAIELAAARINVLTIQQILKRLDDRFNLLTDGMRTALPRQQTLRATIEWSYSLLAEKERILFRRLAVFTGGWTLEAAEKVCSGEGIQSGDVLNLLSQLINKSLVVVEMEELQETRYRRLEIIREFAREKLIEATEAGRLQDRHLAFFLKKAEEIEPHLARTDPSAYLDYLERELDNIRYALEWSISTRKGDESLRLFGALGSFWFVRRHYLEGVEWFRRAMILREMALKSAQGKVLRHAGNLYVALGNFSVSRHVLRESLDIYRELGDEQEVLTGLQLLEALEVGQ
jgi:predicted ATPase/DNA-binding SARP family transcriptional activator